MRIPQPTLYSTGKTKIFPLKIRIKTRVFTFPSHMQHCSVSLPTAIRQEKEINYIQIGKVEVKLSYFADDRIVYIENPIVSTKKLLFLISEFGKIMGYKANTQKSMAFLYTNNEITERETRSKIPFTILTRKIK